MILLTIKVYGEPAPQGSKKFVGKTKDGRGLMTESSKKVAPWRQDVVAAVQAAKQSATHLPFGTFPIEAAVALKMVFTLPKPLSAPKRRRSWPSKKPDLSKLIRSTEDALVTAGLLVDDARIVQYDRAAKVFPREDPDSLDSPGCLIEIRIITE